jgi:hypothetical protein
MDVAKAQLDIALRPTGERWAVTNDETGITALVVQLQAMQPMLIVLEATGGYHRAVVAALAAAALPIVVVNPRQYETLRKRLGSWPKPMRSMPVLWLTLRRPCGPCRARCRMHRRQRCALFWRGGGN